MVKIYAKPDVQNYVQSLDSPDVIHVHNKTIQIEETAEAMINGVTIPLAIVTGKTVNKAKVVIQCTKTMISMYIPQHPEYNSYRGLEELAECEELKQILAGEFMDCLGIEIE